jgi:hemolysin III
MSSDRLATAAERRLKPRLRGVLHQYAFGVAVLAGAILVAGAETARARISVAVYAGSLAAMFGASALYHRITWPPAHRRRLRRLDHAAIYLLIAGTYTPFGTLALSGSSRVAVLAVVWAGALAGIVLASIWSNRPRWVEPIVAVVLGWIGILVLPQLVEAAGVTAVGLVFAGGVCYTAGSLVYARRRPDPVPAVFGYHELFHALVIVAAACQYAAIASLVLPGA